MRGGNDVLPKWGRPRRALPVYHVTDYPVVSSAGYTRMVYHAENIMLGLSQLGLTGMVASNNLIPRPPLLKWRGE